MTQLDAEIQSRLHDVADRCSRITEYVGTSTFAQFDRKTRAAVEREMITIGEALRASLRIMPALEERFGSLDPAIIGTLATTEVPLLEQRVRELLAG